jgi:hypothetical protein
MFRIAEEAIRARFEDLRVDGRGGARACIQRSKVSMMRMRPPQQGHGGSQSSASGASTALGSAGRHDADRRRQSVRIHLRAIWSAGAGGRDIAAHPAKPHQSAHYDHASIPATLEACFGLKALTQRDANANNLTPLLSLSNPRGDAPMQLQPCENAHDHSAGQTPSFWSKLYRAGTEPLPAVQIKATLRDKRDIPRLLPNWHTEGGIESFGNSANDGTRSGALPPILRFSGGGSSQ